MKERWLIKAGKVLPLDTPRPWGDGRKVVAWIAGRIDCAGRKPVARWNLIAGLDDDVLVCRRGERWHCGFGLLVGLWGNPLVAPPALAALWR